MQCMASWVAVALNGSEEGGRGAHPVVPAVELDAGQASKRRLEEPLLAHELRGGHGVPGGGVRKRGQDQGIGGRGSTKGKLKDMGQRFRDF